MIPVTQHKDYDAFDPADYVDNPIALARIRAGITQESLAKKMGVPLKIIQLNFWMGKS